MQPLGEFDDGPGKATDGQLRVLHKLSPADTMDELLAYLEERFQAGPRLIDITRHHACEMVDTLAREAMR
jgi:hypothetical protein